MQTTFLCSGCNITLSVIVGVSIYGCNGSATVSVTRGTQPYTYLWSTGQTTQTDTRLCVNNYSVTFTDSANCTVVASFIVSGPEDIADLQNTFNFEIYPNPNNGVFTLKIDVLFTQAALIIFDVTGKQILQQNITKNETQLNLLAYPQGMYFYQLIIEEKVFSGKVAVN